MDEKTCKNGIEWCANPVEHTPEKCWAAMGLGKLGSKTLQRCFRWLFLPNNHPEISSWVQKIKCNYINKTMFIEVFDDIEGEVFGWLAEVRQDEASRSGELNNFNGLGQLLSTIKFKGLEIIDHSIEYDYASSAVQTHKITLKWRTMTRANKLNIN